MPIASPHPTQPQPPQPPHFDRKVRILPAQMVGIALLAALPLAALLGVFGVTERQAQAQSSSLELQLQYPERLRYKNSHALRLRVRNAGSQPLTRVLVRIPDDYLARFGAVQFTPSPQRLTGRDAEFELTDIAAGESRAIVVLLEGDAYGRHAGRISASADGASPIELPLSTQVFP